jgi:hypothetical protein
MVIALHRRRCFSCWFPWPSAIVVVGLIVVLIVVWVFDAICHRRQ